MDTHIEFKRKIDSARNILVGAVPSPAGQIDQITYALIYKFMSDIDDKSARLPGGKRQYFVEEFEKYDWHNLMRLDGQDKLNRYRDALSSLSKNPHLPELFRSIYRNAFLPYNDPRTLNLFLKEIDGIVHTKSDAIGDAYEHLLSITGAQGDVGQFRTPRHIIKFIVDIVQPGKGDTVLDPACGTAGFLIAAYNYVRMHHDGVDEEGNPNGEQRLTADERAKLHGNYYGYDIDPTMVRTATVNMYLHGFSTPNIEIHDTLTSDEYWQNRYDVILANPPFMTPRGGIQPHGKFGVKANRAEVLFVDYIASHLKPNGRAGIIVPEGIIFQSGNAYKELRKSLVENHLYAVVSLPSGVFNPYAGVKTSILLLDKDLAAKKDEILFVKIENDGYSLGAQRRPVAGGQFPEVLSVIERFKSGEELQSDLAHAVPRQQIAESGDYSLGGDRYRIVEDHDHGGIEVVRLDSVSNLIQRGKTPKYGMSDIKVIKSGQARGYYTFDFSTEYYVVPGFTIDHRKLQKGDILINSTGVGTAGRVTLFNLDGDYLVDGHITIVRLDTCKALPDYILRILSDGYGFDKLEAMAKGNGGQIELGLSTIKELKIPLPPIEIQREIVDELDGYQKIIDAAQIIVNTYKHTVKLSPDSEKTKIGDVASFTGGFAFKSTDLRREKRDHNYLPVVKIGNVLRSGEVDLKNVQYHKFETVLDKFSIKPGDILIAMTGATVGKVAVAPTGNLLLNQRVGLLRGKEVEQKYLQAVLKTDAFYSYCQRTAGGGAQGNISPSQICSYEIFLPSIEEQKQIVAELDAEAKLIDANKKLIDLYVQKIKSKIDEVWGE